VDIVNERLLDHIVPMKKSESGKTPYEMFFGAKEASESSDQLPAEEGGDDLQKTRSKRKQAEQELLDGKLEEMMIEITVEDSPGISLGVLGNEGGNEELGMNINQMIGSIFPKKKKRRKTTVAQARKIFENEESQRLIDMDAIVEEGLRAAEQDGIIFLDEIDKIVGGNYKAGGPDVSREGVQRDILPIVEGCTVNTKYGPIKTDYILFIGAGAFHTSKVSDLIPELQGRFPINVKLDSLSETDFLDILTQPQNAIIKQYRELIATEKVELRFEQDALEFLAKMAFLENETRENIGARRLYTVIERLLEEISFYAPEYEQGEFVVSKDYVKTVFKGEEEDFIKDTGKYII
jgi:ATP-dependent HslUV protease ATP-binding subunit HslU